MDVKDFYYDLPEELIAQDPGKKIKFETYDP